jgi:hypothetical protein
MEHHRPLTQGSNIPDDFTDHYRAYKQRRGIQGAILVLATFQPSTLDKPAPKTLQFSNLANTFAAYPTLPQEFLDTPIHAYPIVDNKVNTLTQFQMLKTYDKAAFLATQPKEIEGLVKWAFLT